MIRFLPLLLLASCLPLQPMPPIERPFAGAASADPDAFAFDLYAQLAKKDGDLFFSPYSISSALAMTSAGAKGRTLDEMARVLHFPAQDALHPAMQAQAEDMRRRAGKNVDLSLANALWTQKGRALLPEFLSLTAKHYRAGAKQVDFIGDPESARAAINDWTAKETRGRIRDLLPKGTITRASRLVLTNAIFFKGKWLNEFATSQTRPEEFHPEGKPAKKVPMMHQSAYFAYADLDGLQALEMAYHPGDEFGLVVFLPKKGKTLAAIDARMAKEAKEWMKALKDEKVIVTMPKFKTTKAMSLADTLKGMGMESAFRVGADFTGIDGGRDQLLIGDVIHKAFVEVNESGTEAAAATAVMMALGAAPGDQPPPPPEFSADRPFAYLIRDRKTGAILFLGRYTGG